MRTPTRSLRGPPTWRRPPGEPRDVTAGRGLGETLRGGAGGGGGAPRPPAAPRVGGGAARGGGGAPPPAPPPRGGGGGGGGGGAGGGGRGGGAGGGGGRAPAAVTQHGGARGRLWTASEDDVTGRATPRAGARRRRSAPVGQGTRLRRSGPALARGGRAGRGKPWPGSRGGQEAGPGRLVLRGAPEAGACATRSAEVAVRRPPRGSCAKSQREAALAVPRQTPTPCRALARAPGVQSEALRGPRREEVGRR